MNNDLYMFHNEEGNLTCEIIKTHKFHIWVIEHTEDIKPECHPKFIDFMPTFRNYKNEYFILQGKPIVPEPVIVVKEYKLPI